MTNEVNVVDHVWQFLDGHPCIRMDMTRDIVNSRALARYIIKKRKINTSVDAVMSAMRRYDFKTFEEMFEKDAEPRSRKFSEHYRRVAEEYECEFLDTSEVVVSSDIDAIHFEPSEHRKLGQAVAAAVKKILA